MRSIALAIPIFVLASCAGVSTSIGSGGGALTGATWVLDEASKGSLADKAPAKARIDLVFEGGHASGRAACNSYGAGYQADPQTGTLSFAEFMLTAMACDEPLMDLESAYLAALSDVTGYEVTGDQAGLVLTGGDVALTFVADQPAAPLALEGTAWTVTTIASPSTDAVSSVVAGTRVTLQLEGGSASGFGGCNQYHGSYETSGTSLTFGPIASTKKACEDAVEAQERAYVALLGDVATFAIDGETLSLLDAEGRLLLAFAGMPLR